MKLRFTHRSRRDLDDAWDYISLDSLDAADRFVDRVIEKCLLIAENPGMGRARDELVEGVRSFPIDSHLIFYHDRDGTVFIDRVISGYRDLLAVFDGE